MNIRMILGSVATLMILLSAFMLIPMIISLAVGEEDWSAFLTSVIISGGGALLRVLAASGRKSDELRHIRPGEGLVTVGLGWTALCLVGALPYVFSGAFATVGDALFESVSGFTTTGATALANVESLPVGIMFWRGLTHWLGGLGFLSLMLMIMPNVKASAVHIIFAESSGHSKEKMVSRTRDGLLIIYGIYGALTLLCFLSLMIAGMPGFDALFHAFSFVSTGGFSTKNASVGAFGSAAVEAVSAFFMFCSAINFALFFAFIKRRWGNITKDSELRFFLGVIVAAIALIAINLISAGNNIPDSLGRASFHTISLITSTGAYFSDINAWPVFSQCLLMLIVFVGGMAGSTSGGLKCFRVLLLAKVTRRELGLMVNPKAVRAVRMGGQAVDERVISGVTIYFFTYLAVTAAGILLITLDNVDLTTAVTAVIASVNNAGVGLSAVGPSGSFADLSAMSKVVLSALMIIGRLEIYPVLLLIARAFPGKA